jgi:hypothetical protein
VPPDFPIKSRTGPQVKWNLQISSQPSKPRF